MKSLILALALSVSVPAMAESTKVYQVEGMHCAACAKSVTKQVCKLPGIASCEVEVNKVTLKGENIDDEAVKAGIDKAGGGEYKVVSIVENGAGAETKPAPVKKTEKAPKKAH